jgi:hypothetical protein
MIRARFGVERRVFTIRENSRFRVQAFAVWEVVCSIDRPVLEKKKPASVQSPQPPLNLKP